MIFGRKQLNIERETLLWTNPSPTSQFAAQTIQNTNIRNFKYIKIINGSVRGDISEVIFEVDKLPTQLTAKNGYAIPSVSFNTSGVCGSRQLYLNNDDIVFYNCRFNGDNWNDHGIPIQIYGIGRKS